MRRRETMRQTIDQRTALLRPPERTTRQKIGDFFWDKRTKMCLTRTPVNWLSITVYYVIFLAVVILIFYVSMKIAEAVASRNANRPQYMLGDSMIGEPVLNFFPIKDKRNLIWLGKQTDYTKYVSIINQEFAKYKEKSSSYNTTQFANCAKSPFGYNQGNPCVFFRLTRVLSWIPEPFSKSDSLPDDIPSNVRDHISKSSTPKLWLSCQGTTAKDRDHIPEQSFQVQGDGGFDTSPYPFTNQQNFIDPIVAVQFNDPKSNSSKKVLLSFTCTVWGKKIDHKKAEVDVSYYLE